MKSLHNRIIFLAAVYAAALWMMVAPSAFAQSRLKQGEAFLKENAAKEGVKTTASGLQYKVLQEGTGRSPKASDTVQVHYRGTSITGAEFDSSYKRKKPADFPLNAVIPGWTEGMQLMKEGAKYEFVVPSKLAYGARGFPPRIKPDEVLVFEIELLKVK